MKRLFYRILTCLTLCALLTSALALPASAAEFEDVPEGHWAAESIHRCVELGFFNGESAARFGVGHEMTRSAFTVVLCRFFGWETSTPAETVYPDVASDAWYAGAIGAAYEHGAITNQREMFRPADSLTREELAVMLVRALGYSNISGLRRWRNSSVSISYNESSLILGNCHGITFSNISLNNSPFAAVVNALPRIAPIILRG